MDIAQSVFAFFVNILSIGLIIIIPYAIMLSRLQSTTVFGKLATFCSLNLAALIYFIRTPEFNLSGIDSITMLILLSTLLLIAGFWTYQEASTHRQKIFSPHIRYRFAPHFFEFILLAAVYEIALLIAFRNIQTGIGFLAAAITMVAWPQLTGLLHTNKKSSTPNSAPIAK